MNKLLNKQLQKLDEYLHKQTDRTINQKITE